MIGVEQDPNKYGIILAQDIPVARLFWCGDKAYDIYDFRGDYIGWAKTEFLAVAAAANYLLHYSYKWEKTSDAAFQLVTPSHHATIERGASGWVAKLIDDVTGWGTIFPPEYDLDDAKRAVDARIQEIEAFRLPPPSYLKLGGLDCVTAGMGVLAPALPAVLGLQDDLALLDAGAEFHLMNIVDVLDVAASTYIDLTGWIHSATAAELKRIILLIQSGQLTCDCDLVRPFEGNTLDEFRSQFGRRPWTDHDYVALVQKHLIDLVQQRQKRPNGGRGLPPRWSHWGTKSDFSTVCRPGHELIGGRPAQRLFEPTIK